MINAISKSLRLVGAEIVSCHAGVLRGNFPSLEFAVTCSFSKPFVLDVQNVGSSDVLFAVTGNGEMPVEVGCPVMGSKVSLVRPNEIVVQALMYYELNANQKDTMFSETYGFSIPHRKESLCSWDGCVFRSRLMALFSSCRHQIAGSFLAFGLGKRAINNNLKDGDLRRLQDFIKRNIDSFDFEVICPFIVESFSRLYDMKIISTKILELDFGFEQEASELFSDLVTLLISDLGEDHENR